MTETRFGQLKELSDVYEWIFQRIMTIGTARLALVLHTPQFKFTMSACNDSSDSIEELRRQIGQLEHQLEVSQRLATLGELTKALKSKGLELLLETSGTNPLTGEVDWICLSPKRHKPPLRELLEDANELKVIVEGEQDLAWAEENAAQVSKKCLLYLQPEWDHFEQVTPLVVAYARANPRWRISLQTHKFMGIL